MAVHPGAPHPPVPPESAWRKPWGVYILYFGLGAGLYGPCMTLQAVVVRGTPTADWLAFSAGILALTILNLQHEILHIHGGGLDRAAEAAWLNLASLVTGMNAQQWHTHYSHHAFTGEYAGQLIQKRAVNTSHQRPELLSAGAINGEHLIDQDLDDSIGLLRRDGLLRAIASHAVPLRGLATLLPFLITSVVFSTFFIVHIAAFHIPTSSQGKGSSSWQQQVLQTRNLAHARSPLKRLLTWYAGYHALASEVASQWQLPEEQQQVSLAGMHG
jgi:hypothetical protein